MKFGKLLESESLSRYGGMYVDYTGMKRELKASAKEQAQGEIHPPLSLVLKELEHPAFVREVVPFTAKITQILHSELEKVNSFSWNRRQELREKLHFAAAQLRSQKVEVAAIERAWQVAEEASKEIVDLDKYARTNFTGMRKIIKKYDKMNNVNVSVWLLQRLKGEQFCSLELDKIMVDLSDVYFLVMEARERALGNAKEGVWKPPDSFDRRTTKYWVREKDVLAVKTVIVRHLPVLIYGRRPGDAPDNSLTDHGFITSVYYDSDDFDMYRTRLRREEGATLIRIRWYGKHEGEKTPVFVERKTHHESWVEEDSVKERFQTKDKHVADYTAGRWNAFESLEKQCHSRPGGRSRQNTDKLQKLQAEIQEEILRRKLKPSLRTIYKRAAFQLTSSNDVRISLDWDLMMLSERSENEENTSWCRGENSAVTAAQLVQFPYAVLEIKLNNDAPSWVSELLDTGMLIEVPKFSKFMHGTCELYHSALTEAPHWMADYVRERQQTLKPQASQENLKRPIAASATLKEKEKSEIEMTTFSQKKPEKTEKKEKVVPKPVIEPRENENDEISNSGCFPIQTDLFLDLIYR